MRLLFAGTPGTAVVALEALLASSHEVVGVLTRPDAPAGRGSRMTASAVARYARERDIPVLTPRSIRTDEFATQLRDLRLDAVAVVAYGALIPGTLLDVPRHGWINLHFSLLPAWRGAAPVPAAIRAGDDVTGATTFRIDEGLDTGAVLGTVTEPILPTDTAGELLERLAASGAQLLVATFDGLQAGALVAQRQPQDGISHAPKLTSADAEIDVTLPALAVDRMIRSLTPTPGAWAASRWGRLTLGPVTVVPDAAGGLAPGQLQAGKREVLVGTGTDPVRLSTIKAPGKRAMPAADWARGARPEPGDVIGSDDGTPAAAT